MKLEDLLRRKRSAILERWRKLITETYPAETARFLKSEKDEFANPVGHFIRNGTAAVLDAVLGAGDLDAIREQLDPMVRIRAVQDFRPSEAVGFVFQLKRAVRQEAGAEIEAGGLQDELVSFESRVDDLAGLAFDVYAHCRQQIHEIQVKEIKNRTAVLMRRMNLLIDEPSRDGDVPGGQA
jgi:hypothetical protein